MITVIFKFEQRNNAFFGGGGGRRGGERKYNGAENLTYVPVAYNHWGGGNLVMQVHKVYFLPFSLSVGEVEGK